MGKPLSRWAYSPLERLGSQVYNSPMKAVEAERDLLKEQKAELVEVLTDLLVPEGSISFPNHHPLVRRAREALAKHGR